MAYGFSHLLPFYKIAKTLANCTSNNNISAALLGQPFTAAFTAASGYTLTGVTPTIVMGGVTLTDVWSIADDVITVNIPYILGNLSIGLSAVAAPTGYTVHVVPQSGRMTGYGDVYYKANDESYVMWTGGEVRLSGITKMQFKAVGTKSLYNAVVRQADSYPNISSYTTVLRHSGTGTTESSVLQISAESYFDIISAI